MTMPLNHTAMGAVMPALTTVTEVVKAHVRVVVLIVVPPLLATNQPILDEQNFEMDT